MKKIIKTRVLDVRKVFLKIIQTKFLLIVLLMQVFIAFAGIDYTFAQGTTPGRAKPKATKPAPKAKAKPKPKTSTPKTNRSVPAKKTPTPSSSRSSRKSSRAKSTRSTPKVTNLNIKVNEPNSQIYVSDENGELVGEEFTLSPNDGSPLVLSNLTSGKYTVTVRKVGFNVETREIDVAIGSPNLVDVNLRHLDSYLTIIFNIEKTNVELINLASNETQKFTAVSRRVDRIKIPTGTYEIRISKEGYISQTQSLKVNRLGQEESLIITLKPLPIDKLLENAENSLNNRSYAEAIENAERVLSIDGNNSKANLIMGLASYHKGSVGGGRYLRKALELGEQVIIPLTIFNKEKGNYQLISGNLIVNKSYVEFRNSYNPKLNFVTHKDQVKNLVNSFDENNVSFVSFEANGFFNGKNSKEKVKLYSQNTVITATRDKIFCSLCNSPSDCLCDSAIGSVYTLLYGWQENID